MTTAFLRAQSAPSATTLTTLYTVPASTSSVVSSIRVVNTSTTATKFRIAVRALGASISNEHYINYDDDIVLGNPYTATIGMTLLATDVVSVYATLGTVSFNMFGQENS